jgi:hypothetical protein
MRKIRIITRTNGYCLVSFLLLTISVLGQEKAETHAENASPLPVEVLFGNNRFNLQTLINKQFTPTSRFSFLSVTSFASAYDNSVSNRDFITNSQVSYEVYKNFGLALGMSMNANVGFTPVAGLEYVRVRPALLLVFTPNIHLTHDHNFEGLTVIEWKPLVSENWRIYSRFQALYDYNSYAEEHERSYMYLRLGRQWKQTALGLAANFDWYGPQRQEKGNYGLFVRYLFF